MRLMVVVTKVGHDGLDREYVTRWTPAARADDYQAGWRCLDVTKSDKLVLIDGGATAIPERLKAAVEECLGVNDAMRDVGLLYHISEEADHATLLQTLRACLNVDLKMARNYSLKLDDPRSAVGSMARAVKEGARLQESFDKLWLECFSHQLLEAALEILHYCLTPTGAVQASNTLGEMPGYWKRLKDGADTSLVTTLAKQANPNTESYQSNLTELRDTLFAFVESTSASPPVA